MKQVLSEAILRHWRSYFGEPVASVDDDCGVSLCIYRDPDAESTRIITTVGMSANVQRVAKGGSCVSARPRTELMLFSDVATAPLLQQMLFDLSRYPFLHGTSLHWWQTLKIGAPCLEGSVLDSLLFTFPPYDDDGFATLQVASERIDILWVVPISGSERVLAEAHGTESLEDALEAGGIDLIDLLRKPVC